MDKDGQRYYQKTFKYPAQGWSLLQEMFERVRNEDTLINFLAEADCLKYFEDVMEPVA